MKQRLQQTRAAGVLESRKARIGTVRADGGTVRADGNLLRPECWQRQPAMLPTQAVELAHAVAGARDDPRQEPRLKLAEAVAEMRRAIQVADVVFRKGHD